MLLTVWIILEQLSLQSNFVKKNLRNQNQNWICKKGGELGKMKVSSANELVITKRTSRVIAIPQIWEHARIRKSIRTWSQKNRQKKVRPTATSASHDSWSIYKMEKNLCRHQPTFPFLSESLLAPTEALVAFCGLWIAIDPGNFLSIYANIHRSSFWLTLSLIDADRCWLMMIDAAWLWLMLMLIMILMLILILMLC